MKRQKICFFLLAIVFFACFQKSLAEESDSRKSFYEKGKDFLTYVFTKVVNTIESVKNWFSNLFYNEVPDPSNNQTMKEKKKIEDCLGLNNKIANTLGAWLKGNMNTTADVKAKFFIKSRNYSERITIIESDEKHLEKIKFNITLPTYVIVHGYLSSGTTDWIIDMENVLLKWGNVNTIAVDWSDQHFSFDYFKVARSIETVGNQIATFLIRLKDHLLSKENLNSGDLGRLHCIGHSLGSHVCGYTAYEIKRRRSNWIASRVTGLDPAKPCFEVENTALRLDRDDAPFVDVIHTNSREFITEGLSLFEPLGHFDFYPNGGKVQPGCSKFSLPVPISLHIPVESLSEAVCEHGKAYLYFTESIRNNLAQNCTFWGQPWDLSKKSAEKMVWDTCDNKTCVAMGISSEKYYKEKNENFFVLTSATEPFCKINNSTDKKEVEKSIKAKQNH